MLDQPPAVPCQAMPYGQQGATTHLVLLAQSRGNPSESVEEKRE